MQSSVYLSLGSNLGDRLEVLKTALVLIGELPGTTLHGISKVYNTEPSVKGDEEQPVYANMVAHIKTDLLPEELLTHLNMIESDLGRVRLYPNSPRTLDIDILLYGDKEVDSDTLTVPHPEMLRRDFVMTPLLELAPDAKLPNGEALTREHIETGECLDVLGEISFPL